LDATINNYHGMTENIDVLHRKIKDLEGEVAYLNAQLKQDHRFGLHWIDVPEAFDKDGENAIPILEEVPEQMMMENLLISSSREIIIMPLLA